MREQAQAAIFGIATALPDICLQAGDYIDFVTGLQNLDEKKHAIVKRMVERSEIKRRYSVVRDFVTPPEQWTFFDRTNPNFCDTQKRNEFYKKEAPVLAARAARELLQQWQQPVTDITHIIVVSCTGVMAPGIEFLLLKELGLASNVQRLGINFMGCFGAFRALAVAQALALQSATNRILIVCVELCSLHIQSDMLLDTIIGNALFGDGAVAFLVGAQPRSVERPLFSIVRCASSMIECSLDAMTWDISNHGFVMRLSQEIPEFIRRKIHAFAQDLLPPGYEQEDVTWAIHPGGRAIVAAIEEACGLMRDQTSSTWHVMAEYGNMSSATIPFVLKHISEQKKQRPWTLGLGFGPGLSIEGILLNHVYV